MVWIRYMAAPWWRRWLFLSVVMTAWLVLLLWAQLPRGHWSTPWPTWVTALGLAAVGLLIAAPATQLGQPVVSSYAAVLRGLTPAQLAEVGRALQRGPIPTDPAVLGAAARAIDLARAHRERVSPGGRRLGWVLIVVFAVVLPVLEFVGHEPRMAVLFLATGVFMLATEIRPLVIRRRRGAHLAELRAAAAADPQVAAAVADAVPPASPSTARQRLAQVGLVMAVVVPVIVGGMFFSGAEVDCRTATAVVSDISEHRELLDPGRIASGGPQMAEYRDLAQRLQRRADQVSDPTIRQHLHDIAGLSRVALIVVGQAREPGISSEGLKGLQTHYGNLMTKLVDADEHLLQACS